MFNALVEELKILLQFLLQYAFSDAHWMQIFYQFVYFFHSFVNEPHVLSHVRKSGIKKETVAESIKAKSNVYKSSKWIK